MRRTRTLFALALLLVLPPRCEAEENDGLGDPLPLKAAVAYARRHNAEIREARAKWQAAQARPAQAGALPDPMVDVGYHNERLDQLTLGRSDFSFLRFGASQELPFPGKLGLKKDIATRTAEQAREDFRRVELDIVSRLKMAYAEYAHLHVELDILRRNKTLLEKFARVAEERYAVGDGIQQDAIKAQLELLLLIDRETTLAQRHESQTAELNALLNRPASAPLGAAEHPSERTLTRSLEDLTAAADLHAPELKAAAARVRGGESNVALAHREYLPDFVVRAEYMHKADLFPEWEVGVGIKLPLYFAAKQAAVREAAGMLAEAQAARSGTEHALHARIKDLYAQAQAAERLSALYHTTVMPQARLALDSATSAYQVGKIDFLTLLNSFTVSLEYEMRYHEELADFQKVMAELEAAVGEPLEEEE